MAASMMADKSLISEIATGIASQEPTRGRTEHRDMVAIGVTSLRPNGRYVEIRLAPPESLRNTHRRPGQYIVATFADGEPRFLVLANAPGRAWTLLVDPADELVETLAELRSGDSVLVSGAEGRGYPSFDDVECLVMFATGSGIASVQGVLQAIADLSDPPEIHLYYGESRRDEFAYRLELERLRESGMVRLGLASDGEFVQGLFDAEAIPDQEALYFLCGSPAMMESVSRDLLERGVRAEQIATNI